MNITSTKIKIVINKIIIPRIKRSFIIDLWKYEIIIYKQIKLINVLTETCNNNTKYFKGIGK